jgi:fatty-acyl-CoA synthase
MYDVGMGRRSVNHVPLSPLSFLQRTAAVYPDRCAVRYGEREWSWAETYGRCRALADALRGRGVEKNDTVAVLCPNTPPAVEVSFGVPMAGAVLNMINTRLDAEMVAFILDHAEARFFIVDQSFAEVATEALEIAEVSPTVVFIEDDALEAVESFGEITYEELVAEGDAGADWCRAEDEWDTISLNYTSGTTGNPKGVVYHVCLRGIDAGTILDLIGREGVTHMCGAPIVINMVTTEAEKRGVTLPHGVRIMTAGAAPPSAVLARAGRIGFDVAHAYGLTECYGPNTICAWHPEWNDLPLEEQARLKARQGVAYTLQEELTVRNDRLEPVPADGETIGEIMMRGNVLMKGYLKNPDTTELAFEGGYFHTGDLAVMHPDGYIEIKDRSKDIIISGGENISSIEVESVLYRHPAVSAAAVVARPDDHWGETPCAFLELREGAQATEQDVIDFCRDNMAHFKAPKTVVFGELPKTSTGKIQKFVLRERARTLAP